VIRLSTAGLVYKKPVISLDASVTTLAVAGAKIDETLDGVNLIPHLTGQAKGDPHKQLFWQFWGQAAIREGDWKYLYSGRGARMLFNFNTPEHVRKDLIKDHPVLASKLKEKLAKWRQKNLRSGLPTEAQCDREHQWYQFYFGEK